MLLHIVMSDEPLINIYMLINKPCHKQKNIFLNPVDAGIQTETRKRGQRHFI